MLVYHGTTLAIQKPKIIKNEIGRDFGLLFIQLILSNNPNDGLFAKPK